MAFVPENALEEALDRAAADPMARVTFYQRLMESSLVVMGRATPIEGTEKHNLSITSLRHNGREYLAIFTAESRLLRFAGPDTTRFVMDARPLFESTTGANFVLNASCERGKLLLAREIAYWLDPGSARARRRLRASEARLTRPAIQPRALMDALCLLFKNRGAVQAAYLLEAEPLDRSEPPHPIVGIAYDGDWAKMAGEVSQLAAAVAPDVILDVVQLDPAEPPGSLSSRLAQEPPFYVRQTKPH
jgi:hypothetical protein